MEESKVPLSDNKLASKSDPSSETKCVILQIMTAAGPIVNTVAAGMTLGYSAILLPQLVENDSTNGNVTSVNITDYLNMNRLTITGSEQESWIAASAALGLAPGCWIAGIMMEKFGRKGAYLITSPIFLSAWLMMGLAPNILWLIIGRFLCGLFTGFNGPLSAVFMAETTSPSIRTVLLASISLALSLGIMLSHIFGTWLHWRVSALLCAIFPVLCFIFCAIAPESPTWLVKKHKSAKALKIWIRLRGKYCEAEFDSLQSKSTKVQETTIYGDTDPEKSVETNFLRNDTDQNLSTINTWIAMISKKNFLLPFFTITISFAISQMSGSTTIVFYSVTILIDICGSENAYLVTLILDAIRLGFALLACWLTSNYSSRLLMLLSSIGTIITLFLLSICLYTELGKSWSPIVILIAYICFVSIGLTPVPWMLCGELFASSARGLGSGLTTSLSFVCFFIIIKISPSMMENLGPPLTFATFGIIVTIGTIFLYFFLPETKGKTLSEIEDHYADETK